MNNSYIELGASLAPNNFIRNVIRVNTLEAIELFRKEHNNTDVFKSVYAYDGSEIRQAKLAGPLYCDFDGEFAREDVLDYVDFLVANGCPQSSIQLSFSGNKGFHAEVPFETLGVESEVELNRGYELIVKEISLIVRLQSLDTGIYDNVRLWRLLNSINSKGGIYKIPLTHDEAKLPLDQIKELAKLPRPDFVYPEPGKWLQFPAIYAKAISRLHEKHWKRINNIFEPVGEGQRNTTTFKRALELRRDGKTLDEAVEICSTIPDNPEPLGPREIYRTVSSAYSEKYDVPHISHNSLFSQPNHKEIPWPEPLAEEAYHGLAGQFVKAIEPYTEADPAALLVNFLTAFGSVIGPEPHFRVEASNHPMRLFTILVGDTSKGRKGTSWGYFKNIFEAIDPEWVGRIETGLSSGEGLIWAVRDPIVKNEPIKEKGQITGYQEIIEDQGVKDKRLIIVESEFASTLRVLGREGNVLSAVIRSAWDSGDLQTLTKNNQAKATGAHISIIGHITKNELLHYLSDVEAGNGFGNRFLWICVKRSKSLPFGGNLQEEKLTLLVEELKRAVEFAKSVNTIHWSEETRQLWADIYPFLSEGKNGLVGSLTSRSEAYVTRLACVFALLDKSKFIKPVHLKAALAIWDYVEASIAYIFQDEVGDTLANEILELLKSEPEGLTRTEINNAFERHKTSEQLSAALELLKNLGKASRGESFTGGRSEERWYFNKNSGAKEAKKANKPNRGGYLEKVESFSENTQKNSTKVEAPGPNSIEADRPLEQPTLPSTAQTTEDGPREEDEVNVDF